MPRNSKEVFTEVSLIQMLDAREKRALYQKRLIAGHKKPLICFTMNVAGPIKNSLLIRRGFQAGLNDLKLQLKRINAAVVFENVWENITGNEAFLVVDEDANVLKEICCSIEDADDLGRLYDIDVLTPAPDSPSLFVRIGRSELNKAPRRCLLCGRPAKECSSRRLHSAKELQERTKCILSDSLRDRDSERIAELAVRSLLYEVSVTPKPGLVDRDNNGSHKDMNFYSFLNSASALWPYFKKCAELGIDHCDDENPRELMPFLREAGKSAEAKMLHAANGVNTHKGAIFSMGIVCAAIGALKAYERTSPEAVFEKCSAITKGLTESDYADLTAENAKTAGQRIYLKYNLKGIRGEVEAGFPAVRDHGLPALERLLAEGYSEDEAGAFTLIAILAHSTDTNLIARSDRKTQQLCSSFAQIFLKKQPSTELLKKADDAFIEKNLSPGGSADLLAVSWMMHFVTKEPLLH